MDIHKNNIFIATTPRSGSTLLGMILDQNADIYHSGETFFWGKLNLEEVSCPCGDTPCPILKKIKDEINESFKIKDLFKTCSMCSQPQDLKNSYSHLSIPSFNEQYTEEEWLKLDNYIDESCKTLTRLSEIFKRVTKKRIVVDNTKVIQIGKRLLEKYGWKIILLTRDVRGAINSNKNLAIRKRRPVQIDLWIKYYIQFAKFATQLIRSENKNLLWIKYEDLCNDPLGVIKKACDFIGVNFDSEMVNFKKQKGHTIMGNRMRFDNNNNILAEDLSWRTNLNMEELNLIVKNKELCDLYDELGYKII